MSITTLRIVIILLILLLQSTGGCTAVEKTSVKSVYLAGNEQQLSTSELETHPEIAVVDTYDELKEVIAQHEASIWIDKSAISMVDGEWFNEKPQKYYPVILVGYNDPLYSFRDALHFYGIEGPYVDWSQETLEPGFSLWCILDDEDGISTAFKGFDEIPTVERILIEVEPYLK